jgi:ribosomal protein L7/L12
MRVNLRRLTDAVPELMELEFIAEDTTIVISTTLTLDQANDLHQCLTKALVAAREANFKSLIKTTDEAEAHRHGLSVDTFREARTLIRGGSFINAIKHIRTDTNLGLKEAKDIADRIKTDLLNKGENDV